MKKVIPHRAMYLPGFGWGYCLNMDISPGALNFLRRLYIDVPVPRPLTRLVQVEAEL